MYATEKLARTDALRNANNTIVGYLGTEVREKFENIVTRYGLSSDIADPTRVSRNFERQVKDNIIDSVRAKEWYIQQWRTRDKEIYWKVYVLAKVPRPALAQAFMDEVAKTQEKLKEAKAETKDKKAKKQFKDVMDAFSRATRDMFTNSAKKLYNKFKNKKEQELDGASTALDAADKITDNLKPEKNETGQTEDYEKPREIADEKPQKMIDEEIEHEDSEYQEKYESDKEGVEGRENNKTDVEKIDKNKSADKENNNKSRK